MADDREVRKSLLLAAGTAIVLLFFSAAVTAESGLDYFIDAGGPIDALVRGDWKEFFANQPLMGSFSLFVRAPFVLSVFHASSPTVYWIGSLPCILAMLGLAIWLLRQMQRRGRSDAEQAMVGRALVPLTLLLWRRRGGRIDEREALLLLALIFLARLPTMSMYELSRDAVAKNVVYLAVTLPLLWALGRELYGRERVLDRDGALEVRAVVDAEAQLA